MEKKTIEEFAAAIRKKYNAYNDIPDTILAERFVEKHPVYKDIVDFSYKDGPSKKIGPVHAEPGAHVGFPDPFTGQKERLPEIQKTTSVRQSDSLEKIKQSAPDLSPDKKNIPVQQTAEIPKQYIAESIPESKGFGMQHTDIYSEQGMKGYSQEPVSTEDVQGREKPSSTQDQILTESDRMFLEKEEDINQARKQLYTHAHGAELTKLIEMGKEFAELPESRRRQMLQPMSFEARQPYLKAYEAYKDYQRFEQLTAPIHAAEVREMYHEKKDDIFSRIEQGMEKTERTPSEQLIRTYGSEGIDPERANYRWARELMNQANRMVEASQKDDASQTLAGFSNPIGKDFITLNYNKMFRDLNIAKIINKQQQGKELTDDETALTDALALHTAVMASKQNNLGYEISAGLAEMVPYMAWFAATRTTSDKMAKGISDYVSRFTKEQIVNQAKKQGINLSGQVLSKLGKVGMYHLKYAPTALLFPNTYSTMAESKRGTIIDTVDENPFTGEKTYSRQQVPGRSTSRAILDGVVSGAAEIWGERLFSNLIPVNKLRQGMRFDPATGQYQFTPAMLRGAVKTKPTLGDDLMNNLRKNVSWSGTPLEYVEENYTSLWQEGLLNNNWQWLEGREQLKLFATIAIMGGSMSAVQQGLNKIDQELSIPGGHWEKVRQDADKARNKMYDILGDKAEKYDNAVKNPDFVENDVTVDQFIDNLHQMAKEDGLDNNQLASLFDYVLKQYSYQSFHSTVREDVHERAEQQTEQDITDQEYEDIDKHTHPDGTVKKARYQNEDVIIIDGDTGKDNTVVIEKENGEREMVSVSNLDEIESTPADDVKDQVRKEQQKKTSIRVADQQAKKAEADQIGQQLLPGTIVEYMGRRATVLQGYQKDGTGVMVEFEDDESTAAIGTLDNLDPFLEIKITDQEEEQFVKPDTGGPVLETEGQKISLTQLDANTYSVMKGKLQELENLAGTLQADYDQLQFEVRKIEKGNPFEKSEYELTARVNVQDNDVEQQFDDVNQQPGQEEQEIEPGQEEQQIDQQPDQQGENIPDQDEVPIQNIPENQATTEQDNIEQQETKVLPNTTDKQKLAGEFLDSTKDIVLKEFESAKLILRDGKMMAVDSTGKEMSATTLQKYKWFYIKEFDFSKGKLAHENADLSSMRNDDEYLDAISIHSENPSEILDSMLSTSRYLTENDLDFKEVAIANHLRKIKNTKSHPSFNRFSDKNNITMTLAKSYFSKDGQTVDQVAQSASAELQGDDFTDSITPDDVVEFMLKYPNGVGSFWRQPRDIYYKLESRFEELTGFKPTSKVLNYYIENQKKAEEIANFDKISEDANDIISHFFETNGEINWEAVRASLNADDDRHDIWTVFPGDFNSEQIELITKAVDNERQRLLEGNPENKISIDISGTERRDRGDRHSGSNEGGKNGIHQEIFEGTNENNLKNDTLDTTGDPKQNSPANEKQDEGSLPEPGPGSEGQPEGQDREDIQRKEPEAPGQDSPGSVGGATPSVGGRSDKKRDARFAGDFIDQGSSTPGNDGVERRNRVQGGSGDNFKFTDGGERVLSLDEKIEIQRQAEPVRVVISDKANIDQTLPLLFPEQREDVLKAEQRFFTGAGKDNETGKGILFTNGTGTGKTLTGLGIAKRFAKRGKNNILIVVPNDKKINDWIKEGAFLNLEITPVKNTKDGGEEGKAVITTYHNMAKNPYLQSREWDLLMYDESHKINSNEQGEATGNQDGHFEMARVGNVSRRIAEYELWGARPEEVTYVARKYQEAEEKNKTLGDDDIKQMKEYLRWKIARLNKIDIPDKKTIIGILEDQMGSLDLGITPTAEIPQPVLDAYRERKENIPIGQIKKRAKEINGRTNVVFLSATPFAYQKSIQYGDGTLYELHTSESKDAYEKFMIENFGYRIRYGRLTAPEAEVDQGMMERNFFENMVKKGIISGRTLKIDADYSRDFIPVKSGTGELIDKGIDYVMDWNNKLTVYRDFVENRLNFYKLAGLIESLKAEEHLPRIEQHVKKGRKVVIFHNYKTQKSEHIFQVKDSENIRNTLAERGVNGEDIDHHIATLLKEESQFKEDNPDVYSLNLGIQKTPIEIIKNKFPSAVVINGDIPKNQRKKDIDAFNTDGSGVDVIIIQKDAGKEGISLHDVTGKHQRVLVNLGLPIQPTDAIQTEGRIYRLGQVSNAIFEYPVLQTSFEKYLYSSTISHRTSTAENLAMGHMARGLKVSFVEGYKNAHTPDITSQGTGGKETDKSFGKPDPFEEAKTLYWARQKRNQRSKSEEGADYFATPEPLGYKMVEWLKQVPGESALEPSAGHGALARFYSDKTNNKFIEPSYKLSTEIKLNASGEVINDTFENHHLVNKYDTIAMNPPFGKGGKTAVEHVEKAMNHLRPGGRIVAIVPRGQGDKRMDDLLNKKEKEKLVYEDYHLTATIDLPPSTFGRAGTNVSTRIYIIDRTEKQESTTRIELDAKDNKELFEKIKDLDFPDRPQADEPQAESGIKYAGEFLDNDGIFAYHYQQHSKTRAPMHTVILKETIPNFKEVVKNAKETDPSAYYSRYNKGEMRAGFVFSSEQLSREFVAKMNTPRAEEPGIMYSVKRDNFRMRMQGTQLTMNFHQSTARMPVLIKDGNTYKQYPEPKNKEEFITIESRYARSKSFNFFGEEKIRSTEDVAFIFRQLEQYDVEHSFLVLELEDSKPLIVHAGMGSRAGTVVNISAAAEAFKRFNAKSIYLVHNHPSGKLRPSQSDILLLRRLENYFGEDKVGPGIIIDSYHGKYGVFYKDGDSTESGYNTPSSGKHHNVYTLDKRVYKSNPTLTKVQSPEDVAKFLTGVRFSTGNKLGLLILNRGNYIVGNFILPKSELNKDLGREIAAIIYRYGGNAGIVYGKAEKEKLKDWTDQIKPLLGNLDISIMDVLLYEGLSHTQYQSIVHEPKAEYTENPHYKALSNTQRKNADEQIEGLEQEITSAEREYENAKTTLNKKKREFGAHLQTELDLGYKPGQQSMFDTNYTGKDLEFALKPYRESLQAAKNKLERLQDSREKKTDAIIKGQAGQLEILFSKGKITNYNKNHNWAPREINKAEEKAIQIFGTTIDPGEAGYITRDGAYIDLSGKQEGLPPGGANLSHNSILAAIDNPGPFSEEHLHNAGYSHMKEDRGRMAFTDMGNISTDGSSIMIRREPTFEQYTALEHYTGNFETVEVNILGRKYHTRPERLKQVIQSHFNTEESWYIPQQLFREVPSRLFDNAEVAIHRSSMNKGTPQQWRKELIRHGAREYELEWKNFDIHFNNDRTITKEDILNWNNENKIEVNIEKTKDKGVAVKDFDDTQFDHYQAIPGKNYQEWKVTLPMWERHYLGRHWRNNFNVFGHLRLNDQTTQDGKTLLLIQEIQSDWAQDIRSGISKISMPFEKTDRWVGLLMRHAIEHAVDKGYQKIGWVTGDQMVDLFKSDVYDSVSLQQHGKSIFPATFVAYPDTEQTDPIVKKVENKTELIKLTGKAIAEKLMVSKPENGMTKLDRQSLKIEHEGSEGMRVFYDQIIGNWVNKNLKKYGISHKKEKLDNGQTVHTAEINEQLYNSVARESLPLFSEKPRIYGSNHTKVNRILNTLHETSMNAYPMVVIEKQSELKLAMTALGEHPLDVETINTDRSKGQIEGFITSSNTVYFVSENLTPESSVKVWVHEQAIHGGLRALIPDIGDRRKLMTMVYDSVGEQEFKNMLGESYEYYKDVPNFVKGEEYLARLAEKMDREQTLNPVERSVFDKLMNWIRDLLKKITGRSIKFTETEIRDIARAAISKIRGYYDQNIAAEPEAPYQPNRNHGNITFSKKPDGQRNIIYQQIDPGKIAKLDRKLFDRWRPLRRLQDIIEKRGGQVPEHANVYDYEHSRTSRSGREIETFHANQWADLMRATLPLYQMSKELKGEIGAYAINELNVFPKKAFIGKDGEIKNIIDPSTQWTTEDIIALYMMAKHAPERNFYLELQYEVKNGSGMSDNQADHIVKTFEKEFDKTIIKDFWQAKNNATDFTLNKGVQSGLISKQNVDALKERYQYYVPLRSWMATKPEEVFDYVSKDITGSGYSALRVKAKGRKSIPDHPLPFIASMAHSAIIEGNKNTAKLRLVNLARANPNMKDLLYLEKTWWVFDGNQWNETTFKPTDQALWDKGWVKQRRHMDHYIYNPYQLAKEHEISAYENGRQYIVVVSDPVIARPWINNSRTKAITRTLQSTWLSMYTRNMAQWHTSRNWAFALPNMTRDIRFAINVHGIEQGAGYTASFVSNFRKSHGAISRAINGKPNLKKEQDRYYQEWVDNGGPTGYVHMWKIEQFKKKVNRDLRDLQNPKNKKNPIRLESKWMEAFSRWSEDMVRFNTYYTSRKKGHSIMKSVMESKEASINFDRKGELSGIFAVFYNFFNSRMQSSRRKFGLWKNHPWKMGMIALAKMTTAFIGAYILDLLLGDDEEETPKYDKISEYIRHRYNLIPIPGTGMIVSIPSAHGFRMYDQLGKLAYDVYSGRKNMEETLPWIVDAMSDTYAPVDVGSVVNSEGEFSWRPFVPSVLTPYYETRVNENFAGFPITREPYTLGMDDKTPNSQRHFDNVSPLIKEITDWNFRQGGGDPTLPTRFYYTDGKIKKVRPMRDINPAVVEHYLSNMFGGRGMFYTQSVKLINNTIKAAHEQIKGTDETYLEDLSTMLETRDIPFFNRWVREAQSDALKRWYWDNRRDEKIMLDTYEIYKKDMDWVKANSIRENDDYGTIKRNQYIHENIDDLRDLEQTMRIRENEAEADDIEKQYRSLMKQTISKPESFKLPYDD